MGIVTTREKLQVILEIFCWIGMIFICFIIICFGMLLWGAETFEVTDGTLNISWNPPEDTSNLWGYKMIISDEFLTFTRYYQGINPPQNISIPFEKDRFIRIRVYSMDLNKKLGGYSEIFAELTNDMKPKGLDVE